MEENRPLTREEIEDIFNRLHIQEYEWYIDDKEDEHFCSSSKEDAELVEKAIKGLINQYNNDYISKDKIRDKIEQIDEEYYTILRNNKKLDYINLISHQHNSMKTVLEELLEEQL